MGQKVNPIGLRLGFIKGWESSWFNEKDFAKTLLEDIEIRKYIKTRYKKSRNDISKIFIERKSNSTRESLIVIIYTTAPGSIIGRQGKEVDKLEEELNKLTGKKISVDILEIKNQFTDAKLVGNFIASQIERRMPYKKSIKKVLSDCLRSEALGVKVRISGRLGGAEMARSESYKNGRIPLHTLRADIDYAISEAQTTYGKVGIKVWIFIRERYKAGYTIPTLQQEDTKKGQYPKRRLSKTKRTTSKNDNYSKTSKQSKKD